MLPLSSLSISSSAVKKQKRYKIIQIAISNPKTNSELVLLYNLTSL